MKIAFFCPAGKDRFLKSIVNHLKAKKHNVKMFTQGQAYEIPNLMAWSDVSWFEWVSDAVAEISYFPKLTRTIVRCHRFEVYEKLVKKVNWDGIDDLIFVSPSMKRLGIQRVVEMAKPKVHVIPNGINMEKFKIEKMRKDDGKLIIGSVGYINHRKNHAYLFQLVKELMRHTDKEVEIHIAGIHQSEELRDYLDYMKKELKLNITEWGWVKKPEEFIKGIDMLVSTSMHEGCPVAIMEGMSMGIKPAIHTYMGARGFFPNWSLFGNMQEFLEIALRNSEPEKYRKWVRKYSQEKLFHSVDVLLKGGH